MAVNRSWCSLKINKWHFARDPHPTTWLRNLKKQLATHLWRHNASTIITSKSDWRFKRISMKWSCECYFLLDLVHTVMLFPCSLIVMVSHHDFAFELYNFCWLWAMILITKGLCFHQKLYIYILYWYIVVASYIHHIYYMCWLNTRPIQNRTAVRCWHIWIYELMCFVWLIYTRIDV